MQASGFRPRASARATQRRAWPVAWSLKPAALLLLALVALGAAEAPVGPLRIAIVAGNDNGGAGTRPLRYAQRDAQRIHEILTRLGGFGARESALLVGRTSDALLSALAAAEEAIVGAARRGRKTVLVIYYSGHAKDGALRMGESQLPLQALKDRLTASGADVRVALVDSCRSGELTRLKGARAGPEFSVDLPDASLPRGLAILTSSSGDEDSQESDLLAASFFTHYLASGLLGGADASGDGRVTLGEAYAYAYDRTLGETASTRAGPQHPTYAYDLAGSGELWMTDLGGARGGLVFPAPLSGTWFVVEARKRVVAAEVAKIAGVARRLALPPGDYEVKRRERDHVLMARVRLAEGEDTTVEERGMKRLAVTDDLAKGADPALVPLLVRETRVSLAAWAGVQGFFSAPVREGFFPSLPLVGLELELRDLIRPDMFVSFDLGLGGADHVAEVDGAAYDTRVSELTGGVSAAYEWDLGAFRPFFGAGFSTILVGREFTGGEFPGQGLATISPRILGGGSLSVTDWLSLGLRGRMSYLLYNLDGNRSVAYGDLAAAVRVDFP